MDLRTSLDLFTEGVVWSEASDYRQLLLSDTILMNERLAKFYGQQLPAGHGFRPVKMDAEQRAGVLTHPYLLATFSYTKSTSPIHRGVFLSRNILGRMLKPPPMAIAFMDDKFDPSFTMREKVTELTAKPACQSCHITINPLGFSFERFDAVGRVRETDNAKPVNTVSEYIASDGTVLTLRGARGGASRSTGLRPQPLPGDGEAADHGLLAGIVGAAHRTFPSRPIPCPQPRGGGRRRRRPPKITPPLSLHEPTKSPRLPA
jgi:hypothetical protein